MNKKGFTLIELLAVIVILAIIALIATPIVLSIIKDSRESAGLRSAEMYLDAVEQSVSIEKMDNTSFNLSVCTVIKDGNLECEGTEVKVEVKGEVPQEGSTITFEKGKIKDVTLTYSNNKTIVKDTNGKLAYSDEEIETGKVGYTAYVVGDEVIVGGESFYVIVDSDETESTVTLLAKDCIDTTTLVQSSDADLPAFSSTDYWSSETEYPVDLNNYTIPEGETSIIIIAKEYGTKMGGIGRLMTIEEAQVLDTPTYGSILYGDNGKSSSTYLKYWLGSANCTYCVWDVNGNYARLENAMPASDGGYFGVRPVVEISKSKIN